MIIVEVILILQKKEIHLFLPKDVFLIMFCVERKLKEIHSDVAPGVSWTQNKHRQMVPG